MIRGALLLICVAGSELVPYCELKKAHPGEQPLSVFNAEQWSRRRNTEAQVLVGEYHSELCFNRITAAAVGIDASADAKFSNGKANQMFAVRSGKTELNQFDICYGWPEPEFSFTRIGPPSGSEVHSFLQYLQSKAELDYIGEYQKKLDSFPYEGRGDNVQSFSGLKTLNFTSFVTSDHGIKSKVALGESELTIYLKENRPSDCFLLFSAISPVTNRREDIDYIKFEKATNVSKYTLSRQLIASLYSMGDFDLTFTNNHRENSCEDGHIIDKIGALNSLQTILGERRPFSLELKRYTWHESSDNFAAVKIDVSQMSSVIANLRQKFPDFEFVIPFQLQLECSSQIPVNEWYFYAEDQAGIKKRISPSRISARGAVVTVELGELLQDETKVIILGFKVCRDKESVVSLRTLVSESRNTETLSSIDGTPNSDHILGHFVRDKRSEKRMQFVPRTPLKPSKGTTPPGSWNTEYWNTDELVVRQCGDCRTANQTGSKSFWACRSECKIKKMDESRFAVSRSATFNISEIPRLWGAEPHHIFGYAIDLNLPPCAQKITQLKKLKVSVKYKNLTSEDKCRQFIMGTASLNVPEFTPSVYYNKQQLHKFVDYHLPRNGNKLSYYYFDLKPLAKMGTLPKSIIIGYHEDVSCVDKIEKISVEYELRYEPPRENSCKSPELNNRAAIDKQTTTTTTATTIESIKGPSTTTTATTTEQINEEPPTTTATTIESIKGPSTTTTTTTKATTTIQSMTPITEQETTLDSAGGDVTPRRVARWHIEGGLSNRNITKLCFMLSSIAIFLSNTQ